MAETRNKFALIGAGPMGLAAAKLMVEHGLEFQGFELNSDVGGLWDIDAPRSTMYESAHLISSKRMTEFTDFPMDDGVAEYPSHHQMKRYFRAFADHYNLRDHYHFNAEVLRCTPLGEDGDGWRVRWRDPQGEHEADFAGIMIANGTLSEPNMPDFKGAFTGTLIHAAQYKSATQFAGKRVLVVGAGNSGCDIAIDAIHHGISCDLSMRRGYHFVPKYIFGKPADTLGGLVKLPMPLKRKIDGQILKWFVGNPQKYGFPEPDHKLYESQPVVNSLVLYHAGHGDLTVRPDIARLDGNTVHFTDGSKGEYDMILAATGYHLHYPFIDKSLLNWQGFAPHLFLNTMHPARDDLFMLGMIEAIGLGWQGRHEQAEMVMRYILGQRAGSAAAKAIQTEKTRGFQRATGGVNYIKLARMAYYVNKDAFLKEVRKRIAALKGSAA